jgi:hypothetical protein
MEKEELNQIIDLHTPCTYVQVVEDEEPKDQYFHFLMT